MGPRVFLVGAGPGDPELLTLRAARLLGAAEIVLHDSLVDARILAMADGAELIDVGKRCGRRSTAQETINELLVDCARTGRIVVRLKGGDPMIFGRATEEMDSLAAAGIAFEVVPGVTAVAAVAASLKLSLTRRQVARSLHLLTGHGAEGGLPGHDWAALAQAGGTLAIYMGGQTVAGLAAHFIEAGLAPQTPAIAVENASLESERRIFATIATLPGILDKMALDGPVMLLVGQSLFDRDVAGATLEHDRFKKRSCSNVFSEGDSRFRLAQKRQPQTIALKNSWIATPASPARNNGMGGGAANAPRSKSFLVAFFQKSNRLLQPFA